MSKSDKMKCRIHPPFSNTFQLQLSSIHNQPDFALHYMLLIKAYRFAYTRYYQANFPIKLHLILTKWKCIFVAVNIANFKFFVCWKFSYLFDFVEKNWQFSFLFSWRAFKFDMNAQTCFVLFVLKVFSFYCHCFPMPFWSSFSRRLV